MQINSKKIWGNGNENRRGKEKTIDHEKPGITNKKNHSVPKIFFSLFFAIISIPRVETPAFRRTDLSHNLLHLAS